jgi:DNA-binding XRE family transcriptional regulator
MPRRKPNAKDLAAREVLAEEMKSFRRDNLFNQKKLAEVLELSRRTIQMIEGGSITPHPGTIKAFKDLAAKFKAAKEVTI